MISFKCDSIIISTFTPTTFDRVAINGTEYKVVQINTNEQNNTAISFDIFLR